MLFETPGGQNTNEVIDIALKGMEERGIHTLVVCSNTGASIEPLLARCPVGTTIVCVTHVNGFREPGIQEMSAATKADLQAKGVKVVTAAHALSAGERGLSKKFGGVYPLEIVAHTLRMFGQGVKVCVEIAVMALDAGEIGYMEPVVVLGGTGRGWDTAVVMRTAHAAALTDCKVDEILCKPRT